MKLLLTSAGLKNQALIDEFLRLVDKPAKEIKVAYIPTAANLEEGNKDWQINNLWEFKNLVGEVDIVELTALPKDKLESRLKEADAIVVGGGLTSYLAEQINRSGLKEMLPDLLNSKVYVGISAGSMIMGPSIDEVLSKRFYNESMGEGLGYVDFWIKAHLNSTHDQTKDRSKDHFAKIFENSPKTVYAIDDNSAVVVENGNTKAIGEGEYLEFKK